jgi:deoxycytidylate deaminase
MHDACIEATYSLDRSSQVGAVILNTEGGCPVGISNHHFFDGVDIHDESNYVGPKKYEVTMHAEPGEIENALIRGENIEGSTTVLPWAACGDCVDAIIDAGLGRVVQLPYEVGSDHWSDSIMAGRERLHAAGVEVEELTGVTGLAHILRSVKRVDHAIL